MVILIAALSIGVACMLWVLVGVWEEFGLMRVKLDEIDNRVGVLLDDTDEMQNTLNIIDERAIVVRVDVELQPIRQMVEDAVKPDEVDE